MYQVQKMSPPPANIGRGRGRPRKYPFDKCGPGQGFVVDEDDVSSGRQSLQNWKKGAGAGQVWSTGRISATTFKFYRVS